MNGKWAQPRQAILDGKVVFFPRTAKRRVWTILAGDRKKGLKIAVRIAVYQECPGAMVWRI